MRFKLLTSFVLAVAIAFGQSPNETPFVPGEMLVQFELGTNVDEIANKLTQNYPQYEIKKVKSLSAPMGIWMFTFEDEKVSHSDMINIFSQFDAVIAAQNNHYIEERAGTLPDDPQISSQWHHVNDGSGGGIADADVDSDLAWDVTTGGLTEFGDEIVVCIVEGGGADLSHPDLIDNHWYNHGEIPDNGIDDDNNGYVDDYAGWDVGSGTDNFPGGGHGTNCAGMVGAKGNNGLGVVGMNWDVKIMMVSGFSAAESQVIQAYAYPLTMRKMYNESNGEEGAFVVVTSASWGIDGGNPADSPLWCNYYDSLGVHGVLNMGATTNSNQNVDVVGDLPTACPSDYQIAVTATNRSDVRTFSGYGVEHIDIAAPGENVFMTSNNGGYSASSGTSFATPLTAGAVGLIYSMPCASFMALVKSDPQTAADMVREALYEGLDPVDNLDGETKYGGRLNVYNAIQILMDQCDTTGCLAPYGVMASDVTDTQATISWNTIESVNEVQFGIAVQGSNNWSTATSTTGSISLDTLMGCMEYDVYLISACDTSNSDSTLFTFKTDGCCEAPATVEANPANETSVEVSWTSVLAAESYDLTYQSVGGNEMVITDIDTNFYLIEGLDSCTAYTLFITTNCAGGNTVEGEVIDVLTLGCGICSEGDYCESKGENSSYEWLDNVVIGDIANNSGDDGGYAFFEDETTILYTSEVTNVNLTPGFSGTSYDEQYRIWIDMNQNGEFEESELLFDEGLTDVAVSGTMVVPSTSMLGSTRMRVSMKYEAEQTPCETFSYGEVEDYCVFIELGDNVSEWNVGQLEIYPNPSKGIVNISYDYNGQVRVYNLYGQLIQTVNINAGVSQLNLEDLATGTYIITVESEEGTSVQRVVIE